jgi:hypothetical protein
MTWTRTHTHSVAGNAVRSAAVKLEHEHGSRPVARAYTF